MALDRGELAELEEILESLEDADLDDRSRDFVDQTAARYEKYGEDILLSEDQWKYLRDLGSRV